MGHANNMKYHATPTQKCCSASGILVSPNTERETPGNKVALVQETSKEDLNITREFLRGGII